MAKCTTCGNEYDKTFTIDWHTGETYTFDSFECAIHALAPVCQNCGVKIIGHGLEAGGTMFCCAHCAAQAGVESLRDRTSERATPP